MKRYIVYVLLVLSGFCVSCDEYLKTKTYGEILPETTEDYASLLHTHLYNIEAGTSEKILGNFNDVLRWECFSDNLNASLSTSVKNTPIYVGSYISSAIYRFNNLFQVVKDANVVLDNVKGKDSELDKKITAIAYTLRAVVYYNMMRELCEPYEKQRATEIMGVPIVDHFDMEAKPGRGNIQETVDFIVEDLKKAISLNQVDEKYIFTVDVAKAYLAKTYFWAQDWKNAVSTAKELLDKGHSVIYFTAFQLFDIFEKDTFQKDAAASAAGQNIFDCDLLIIDDLGTELANSFTASRLFLCLNERMLRQKSTLISTNLSIDQLADVYSERICSRIFSSYTMIKLFGDDIRLKKKLH